MRNLRNTPETEYSIISTKVSQEIQRETDEQMVGIPTGDLVEYYYENNYLQPLEIDIKREAAIETVKRWEVVHSQDREGPFRSQGDLQFECVYLLLYIPIVPHTQLNRLNAIDGFDLFAQHQNFVLQWLTDSAIITIPTKRYGYTPSDEEVIKIVEEAKQWFQTKISHLKAILNNLNNKFKQDIESWIVARKSVIEQHRSRYESLLKKINIPITKKEDASTSRIKLNPRPVAQRIKPNPSKPEEYVINRDMVLDIIHVLDNQGKQFEKTPKTYMNCDEEDLRNVLLVNLNALFEGKATGETFSNKGKSDIYLNIDKGNILVFECKFWSGPKMYQNTIEQLLGYLTWRMNYGVLIKFCKQKNFMKILSEVKTTVESHPSYRSDFKQINDTHFISQHRLPNDDQKNVEIHHLFYRIVVD